MKVNALDTPCLVIDKNILEKNIMAMAELAKKAHVNLRPHIKAHKCSEIAKMQIDYGANGITVAKLSEAEAMFAAGIKDILIAYQLVTSEKLNKLAALISKGAKIACLVDDLGQAQLLNNLGEKVNIKIAVYVEVDSGLKRTGLEPEKVVDFIKQILKLPYLKFKGILTHAGQVYGVNKNKVQAIGNSEGKIMEQIAIELKLNYLHDFVVSVGSTPTVKYSAFNPQVTEIRPGNYVFYDAIQVGLGVVDIHQCSLKVLTTVISKPSPERIVVDAGSKTLALDRGAHGTELVQGFGIFLNYPNLVLERLSEEHGVVKVNKGKIPEIGEKLYIIPNHACPVVNLADELIISENDIVRAKWPVDARGKNK